MDFPGEVGIGLLLLSGWLAQQSLGHQAQTPLGHWQGRRRGGSTAPGMGRPPNLQQQGAAGERRGPVDIGESILGDGKGFWHILARLSLTFPGFQESH